MRPMHGLIMTVVCMTCGKGNSGLLYRKDINVSQLNVIQIKSFDFVYLNSVLWQEYGIFKLIININFEIQLKWRFSVPLK